MTEPAHDPAERVRALMKLTQSLDAIFAQENALLESQRPRELAPLQAEKARLAAAYAQSIRDVAQNRASVHGADARLISELRDITRAFEARASRQRALLAGASKAGEGVVRAIADEARSAAAGQGYGREAAGGGAAPVSFNEDA